jgi:DNA topoisomerase-2
MTEKYRKYTQIEHVLNRPDMYIGGIKARKSEEYIFHQDLIQLKSVKYPPGLKRLFIEILTNAIDNVETSIKEGIPCKRIKIEVGDTEGPEKDQISIYNDGAYIPIEKNSEGVYFHTMLFSEVLTSSNYDDTENRFTAGRNGLGGKVVGLFSTVFSIEAVDPKNGLKFFQEWRNNISETNGPIIKNCKLKTGYTLIKWIADFFRFGVEGYTKNTIALFKKLAHDASMLTGINVYFNGDLVRAKTLSQYASLYFPELSVRPIMHQDVSVQVLIVPSESFQLFSFVNGIYTPNGGVHANVWVEAILRPIVDKYNTKKGNKLTARGNLTIKDVKNYFTIFIVARVENPEFDSQEKNELLSYKNQPKGKPEFPEAKVKSILKWENTKRISELIKDKEITNMKKSINKQKKTRIPGLDNANKAGGKYSQECSLILCEGNSAKPFAVSGIHYGIPCLNDKKGRDYYGVLPLRGKILNVRGSSPAVIAKNAVINNIIQTLGLKYGVDYSTEKNMSTLSYGKLIILCDSDVDGIHISSLIINFFHYLFPSLIRRNFIISMQTPILRIFYTKKDPMVFYSEVSFKKYMESVKENEKKKGQIKYYKGLGSSSGKMVQESFGKKILKMVADPQLDITIEKTFGSDTEKRKEWILNYRENGCVDPIDNYEGISNLKISEYLNNKLIEYSINDCKRSIPSVYDGLKESQRKILYTCFCKKLEYTGSSLKVVQLGGAVAEKTSYHHGEANLFSTIVKMAQCFIGTNNIPLLFRDGQFGSRLNDKDAANPRYIFTKLDMLTRLLFREEDNDLLNYLDEDGEKIEPEYYVPILPTILINGGTGIGTGWSCDVPLYNPLDVIKCVKGWINSGDNNGDFDITPWYRGFNGTIEKKTEKQYISWGVINEKNGKKIISEIPVGKWIDGVKEQLEDLTQSGEIQKFDNNSTAYIPNFIVSTEIPIEDLYSRLKLFSYIKTSNMVLFEENNVLKKFGDIWEIIDTFCKKRLELYINRKKHILAGYREKLEKVNEKYRFINMVITGELVINNQEENMVIHVMKTLGFKNCSVLLDISVRHFTREKLEDLAKEIGDIKELIQNLEGRTEKEIWLGEIGEFTREYKKWLKIVEKE